MDEQNSEFYDADTTLNKNASLSFRKSDEIDIKIKFLLKNYGDRYDNISHVIRCAIIRLYNFHVREEREEDQLGFVISQLAALNKKVDALKNGSRKN